MSDTFRQVGDDLPAGGDSVTAAQCQRKLSITTTPTASYEISGNRATLLSGKPDIGAVFETVLGVDFRVTKIDLDDLDGGQAKMTIYTEATLIATYTDPIGDPVCTVEFQELRKKIETHPCMGQLTNDARLAGKSFEQWQDLTLDDWIDATSIPAFWSSIGAWAVDDYQTMKEKGEEDYVMYPPVLTRTLSYTAPPTDIGIRCGTQQTPPAGSFPFSDLYDWLAGPDSLTRKGAKFERKTTWIGADFSSPASRGTRRGGRLASLCHVARAGGRSRGLCKRRRVLCRQRSRPAHERMPRRTLAHCRRALPSMKPGQFSPFASLRGRVARGPRGVRAGVNLHLGRGDIPARPVCGFSVEGVNCPTPSRLRAATRLVSLAVDDFRANAKLSEARLFAPIRGC